MMMVRYGVAKAGDTFTREQLTELILLVDILPPSLVVVQGAIESGWLQSRFARKGQAIFGLWTTSKSGIKALNSSVRLAAFDNSRQAWIVYMLNVHSHQAYRKLREARAELRRKGKVIDGYTLAGFMDKYAEIGERYVDLICQMIRRDHLTRGDTAKLGDGPRILFRRIDQKWRLHR
jgi:Bax protein